METKSYLDNLKKRVGRLMWKPGFKASDIFGLFLVNVLLWVENFSKLCKLIVCGILTLRSTQQTQRAEIQSYASRYKKNVLVIKGMPTNM